MITVLTETIKNRTINVKVDEHPSNPRECDNLGTILYTDYSRYILGDKAVDRAEIEKITKDKRNIYLPVYAYIHGGVSLSTGEFSCQWDSGQCGIIYMSKAKVRKEYGEINQNTIKKALSVLRGEVEEYSQFLEGQVYGYVIIDENDEVLDSCWGFYDEPSEVMKIAKHALKGIPEKPIKPLLSKLIKNDLKLLRYESNMKENQGKYGEGIARAIERIEGTLNENE